MHRIGARVADCWIDQTACFLRQSCLSGLLGLLIPSELALVDSLQDRLTALLLMLMNRIKRYLSACPARRRRQHSTESSTLAELVVVVHSYT